MKRLLIAGGIGAVVGAIVIDFALVGLLWWLDKQDNKADWLLKDRDAWANDVEMAAR